MIMPVGVGFRSCGPIGAVGSAVTIGHPASARFCASPKASNFERLYGPVNDEGEASRASVARRSSVPFSRMPGCAGVDDFLYSGRFGCLENIDRSLHVVRENFLRVSRPETVIARDMKHVTAIFHRRFERVAPQEIAFKPFESFFASRRRRADESAHFCASLHQLIRHMPADEAGGAGDENLLAGEGVLERGVWHDQGAASFQPPLGGL